MAFSGFTKFLLTAVGLSVAGFFLMGLFLPISGYLDFLFWSILFFGLLFALAYFLGERSMNRSGGSGYIGMVIASVFLKLIASFLFVALYAKYQSPPDRFFLVPFLFTYLVFTGYETYVMSTQARGRK